MTCGAGREGGGMSTDRKESTTKAGAAQVGRRELLLTGAAISVGSLFTSSSRSAAASSRTIDIPGAGDLVEGRKNSIAVARQPLVHMMQAAQDRFRDEMSGRFCR